MTVRKCKVGELKNIIQVANNCFIPHRTASYTFVNSVPCIYNNPFHDYSDIHFVVEENNEMVSVGGNIISEIKIGEEMYKFSRVGTIGTLSNYRNKGYMKEVMNAIDQENKEKEVVFSILEGRRSLYNHYGYEKAGVSKYFSFYKEPFRRIDNKYNVIVREYQANDLEEIYSIYLKNNKIILRNKEEFRLYLKRQNVEDYTILVENKIVGYYGIKKETIVELNLIDNKYLESAMLAILNNVEYNNILVYANLLNKDLCDSLSKIADYTTTNERLCFKIYDLDKFIKILYYLNDKSLEKSFSEIYMIGNETYEFKVSENNISVNKTKKQTTNKFYDINDFIRFALGTDILLCIRSKIFPLFFDIGLADKF